MAVEAPPNTVWRPVESLSPGLYRDFIDRFIFGMRGHRVGVSSWWRSPHHNQAVGGHPDSQHLLALAIDFQTAEPQLAVTDLTQLGLVALNEGDHVHVQRFSAGIVAPVIRWLGLTV